MQYCPAKKATHPLWKLWYCTRASGQHPGHRLFVHGDNLRAHLFPTTNCNARGITSNTIGSLPISSPSTVNHIPGRDLIEAIRRVGCESRDGVGLRLRIGFASQNLSLKLQLQPGGNAPAFL
jgi:hypothetical protein